MRQFINHHIITPLIAITYPALSHGTTPTDSISGDIKDIEEELSEFVVTATRAPKLLKDSPVQIRLISSDIIKRTDATDIKDLLQQELPGVEFSYAMDQQVHLNFGGFGGQSILFLADGERLAGETMDDVDFSRLSMSDIGRVEIVRGASSALYGSSAGGGVVNIISKRPTEPWQVNINARIGRHLAQRYGVRFSTRRRVFSNTLSLNYNSVKGYDLDNGPDPQAMVVTHVYGQRSLNIKDRAIIDITDNLSLTARLGYYFNQIERDPNTPRRYRDYSAGMTGQWDISPNDNLQLSYSFDQYDKSDYNTMSQRDVRAYSNVQNTTRLLYNHTFHGGSILTAGADYIYDYLLNNNIDGATHTQQNIDVFAQYDWAISDTWELVAALRDDYFKIGRYNRLTPKLSACYRPHRRVNLRLSYGMGYRVPSLKEMYYNFDMAGIWIVQGNPDLKPEQSHNINFSADYTYRAYNITFMAYYNSISNKIANSLPHYLPGDSRQLYLDYINIDNVDVAGMEISASARWNNGLAGRIAYSYVHESNNKDKEGNRLNSQYLPARPHTINARLDWHHAFSRDYAINLGLDGRFLGSVDNNEYKDYYDISAGMRHVKYPAYALVKLSATASIWSRLDITLALDNLLNYQPRYYYMNSPMTDGINFMATVSLTLD